MKTRRQFWLSILALAAGLTAGCEKAASPKVNSLQSWKVVLLSARGDRIFENGQRTALTRLMAQDPRFVLQVQDAGFSPETQLTQMKEAVAEKPFAILLDPLQPKPLKTEVAAAVNAGILVIGLGEKCLDLGCNTALIGDQRQLGSLAGDMTVRALLLKNQEMGLSEAVGRVIEIRGDEDSSLCQHRHEGFAAALKKAPGVILVHDAPGDWNVTGGRDRTFDALRLQQSFDVVYAHNDLMALGASMALSQKNLRDNVMVIGTDGFRGPEGGITLVSDGEIDATFYHPLLVDLAWVLVRKKREEPAFHPKARYELPLRSIQPKDLEDIRLNGLAAFPEL
ncbi:monosaccharide ABC transporter substrate-binding protein (CUT2 family) [Prosthecobacter fusiformis]|uniref:Monosaccharide ABC transporter substrate-binding protein (CUT2 family) n=1 Tax=Prosthecobacter fusiformis TaxID=48464 RepID=A0A4R7RNX1_9BACT|nr:substrate-binding domain-containing protein [Prosthecobacter fusiformis]TDU67184.1 monosaccharide ABC transporter substrate-binding protein (CUT2 family) [Prosthecobacter fusiformis]